MWVSYDTKYIGFNLGIFVEPLGTTSAWQQHCGYCVFLGYSIVSSCLHKCVVS